MSFQRLFRDKTGSSRRVFSIATTLTTRKKGSTPPGVRIGVKKRGRR